MKLKEGHFAVTLLVVLIIVIIPSFFIGKSIDKNAKTYEDMVNSFSAINVDKDFTLDDLLINNEIQFQNFDDCRVPYSFSNRDTWVRFKIDTNKLDIQNNKYLIVFTNPNIDYIDAYIPIRENGTTSYSLTQKGLMRTLRDSEVNNNKWNFSIPKNLAPNEYIYIKVKSNIDIELTIEEFTTTTSRAANKSLFYGIFYGLLLGIILYNFFINIFLKEINFHYYVLYITSMLLYQMRIHCFLSVLIDVPYDFYMKLLWIFVFLLFLFAMLFVINFLETKKYCSLIDKLIKIFFGIALLISFIGIIGFYKTADRYMHFVQMCCPVIIVIAGIIRFKQGFRPAIYFVNGWIMLCISSITWSLAVYLPFYVPAEYILQAGTGAEALLLSLSLADRFKNIINEKERLEKDEEKYRELCKKDTLTSLYNKRFLIQKIKHEIYSYIKYDRIFSIIIMDIDNFKTYNDKLGHIEGDRILIKVTEAIQSLLRNRDVACRYGGDEIVIILPKTTQKEAFVIAERIRNKIVTSNFIAGDEPFNVSVSMGVAQYIANESYEELIARCDNNLYKAKDKGKNCTVGS